MLHFAIFLLYPYSSVNYYVLYVSLHQYELHPPIFNTEFLPKALRHLLEKDAEAVFFTEPNDVIQRCFSLPPLRWYRRPPLSQRKPMPEPKRRHRVPSPSSYLAQWSEAGG